MNSCQIRAGTLPADHLGEAVEIVHRDLGLRIADPHLKRGSVRSRSNGASTAI